MILLVVFPKFESTGKHPKMDAFLKTWVIFATLSVKTRIVCTASDFFSPHYVQCFRSEYLKLQMNRVCSFEAIALDSRGSKKIDLYSNQTKNKLQALTFAAITLGCICL